MFLRSYNYIFDCVIFACFCLSKANQSFTTRQCFYFTKYFHNLRKENCRMQFVDLTLLIDFRAIFVFYIFWSTLLFCVKLQPNFPEKLLRNLSKTFDLHLGVERTYCLSKKAILILTYFQWMVLKIPQVYLTNWTNLTLAWEMVLKRPQFAPD